MGVARANNWPAVDPERMARGLWWDEAWSLVEGCSPVSAGCANCWACAASHMRSHNKKTPATRERYAGLTTARNRWTGKIRLMEKDLYKPLRVWRPTVWAIWNDLFHPAVPFEFIDRAFAVMALCPEHLFIILTKRPERMGEYLLTRTAMDDSGRIECLPQWYREVTRLLDGGRDGTLGRNWERCHVAAETADFTQPLPQVVVGTTAENQAALDERMVPLGRLHCAGWSTFLSMEPLLESVRLRAWCPGCEGLLVGSLSETCGTCHSETARPDQVIVGGESGPGARPCNTDHIHGVVQQCKAADVRCFVKQGGSRPFIRRDIWHNVQSIRAHDGDIDAPPGTVRLLLKHPKGGDPSEWPDDLRDARELVWGGGGGAVSGQHSAVSQEATT